MNNIQDILQKLLSGQIVISEAERLIKNQSIIYIDSFAQFDIYRERRAGIPEVILAETKTPEECRKIVLKSLEYNEKVLLTRVKTEHKELFLSLMENNLKIQIEETARCIIVSQQNIRNQKTEKGKVAIFAAGTSDRPIAEEARITAEFMGCKVLSFIDIGIAGIHRLIEPIKRIIEEEVSAVVVCAGMEGALPSVVSSLIPIPVIGVPVSVGYGVSKGGYTALLAMLSSCSPGMAVVNIDAGFNAGAMAALIAINSIKSDKNE